jgi:drug/metabolite transporter (DMT)-like permease
MWILFALTSATILASRKIQEKKLVWEGGQAIGWMLRIGSITSAVILWIIFSRDFSWLNHSIVWWIFFYSMIAYPLSVYFYLRAIHDLPLSIFGMLAPFALVVSLFCSWIFFSSVPSLLGWAWVLLIGIALTSLFWKREKWDIHIKSIIFALCSYSLMWLGYSMDKFALGYVDPFFYTVINQAIALFSIGFVNFYFLSWLKIWFFRRNFIPLFLIWLLQGVSYYASMYAVSHSPNIWYATALINTHAILTTLYGIFILKEKITKRKVFVFLCMMGALIAFAFA